MKLRATAGIGLLASPSTDEVMRDVQGFLDGYQEDHPEVLRATVLNPEPDTVRLDVVLAPMPLGEAEALIDRLADEVITHLRASSEPIDAEERETELAPA